jgi:dTDP-4-dehydrorhamnose reductase
VRIAIIGATGQVSRALQALPNTDTVALGRPELDLTALASIIPPLGAASADLIVNAAAYTAVDRAETERDAAFAVNHTGAEAVASAAAALGVPLIHLSTDYVFDGAKGAPYMETDAPNPLNVYGASKLAGERAVMAAQPRSVILRMSWIYGAHGTNFVRTMLRLAAAREEIDVVSDQRGRPTSADEAAGAIARIAAGLLNEANPAFGVFHLGGADSVTWADFAEAIFDESRSSAGPTARVRRITTAAFGAAAARPAESRLDGAKLTAAYGVTLGGWRDALKPCIDALLRG